MSLYPRKSFILGIKVKLTTVYLFSFLRRNILEAVDGKNIYGQASEWLSERSLKSGIFTQTFPTFYPEHPWKERAWSFSPPGRNPRWISGSGLIGQGTLSAYLFNRVSLGLLIATVFKMTIYTTFKIKCEHKRDITEGVSLKLYF